MRSLSLRNLQRRVSSALISIAPLSGAGRTLSDMADNLSPSPAPSSSTPASGTPNITPTTLVDSISATSNSTIIQSSRTDNTTTPSESGVPSPPVRHHSGISSGAIAGIVIGCVAAVALAAALLFWFFVRRRKSSKHQYAQAGQHTPESREKGHFLSTIPPSNGGITSIEALPQPLEDQAITAQVSKISNAIKNHVQSYYHHDDTGSEWMGHDSVRALGSDLPLSVETLTSLMENAATRETALRFAIAWAVISRIQPFNDSSESLLPAEIARYYEDTANKHSESESRSHTAKFGTFANHIAVQSKSTARWRAMALELSHSNYVRAPFDASDSRHASILSLLAVLDQILQPFADPQMDNEERKRNLEEVLKRAASFAVTLFCQPST